MTHDPEPLRSEPISRCEDGPARTHRPESERGDAHAALGPAVAPVSPYGAAVTATIDRAHRTALERGDDLVQHLAVAKYALSIQDTPRAMDALDAALDVARRSLTELLRAVGPLNAGALLRTGPADPGATVVPLARHPAHLPAHRPAADDEVSPLTADGSR